MNHLIKLLTNWKACRLPDLVDKFHAIARLQMSDTRIALRNQDNYQIPFNCGIPSSIGNIVEHQMTCRKGKTYLYEVEYFVGAIIDVVSPEVALIQFLHKGTNGSFRWPTVDDVAEVDCRFAISSDFDILWCDTWNPSATRWTVTQTVAETHPGVSSRHLVWCLGDITVSRTNHKWQNMWQLWRASVYLYTTCVNRWDSFVMCQCQDQVSLRTQIHQANWHDPTEGMGPLQIKCPYALRDNKPTDTIQPKTWAYWRSSVPTYSETPSQLTRSDRRHGPTGDQVSLRTQTPSQLTRSNRRHGPTGDQVSLRTQRHQANWHDSTEGMGLLEIKCPYVLRDTKPTDIIVQSIYSMTHH